MNYYAIGSVGDTFVHVCKLYGSNDAHVKHYVPYDYWKEPIRDLYSLIDVDVEFLDFCNRREYAVETSKVIKDRSTNSRRLNCLFTISDGFSNVCSFPIFNKLDRLSEKFNLPDKYVVVNHKAGRPTQLSRKISNNKLKSILSDSNDVPVVFIGIDPINIDGTFSNMINLIGQTTLLESLSIVRNSCRLYAYHGIFGFFGPSQKIETKFYENDPKLIIAAKSRLLPEWMQYVEFNY